MSPQKSLCISIPTLAPVPRELILRHQVSMVWAQGTARKFFQWQEKIGELRRAVNLHSGWRSNGVRAQGDALMLPTPTVRHRVSIPCFLDLVWWGTSCNQSAPSVLSFFSKSTSQPSFERWRARNWHPGKPEGMPWLDCNALEYFAGPWINSNA